MTAADLLHYFKGPRGSALAAVLSLLALGAVYEPPKSPVVPTPEQIHAAEVSVEPLKVNVDVDAFQRREPDRTAVEALLEGAANVGHELPENAAAWAEFGRPQASVHVHEKCDLVAYASASTSGAAVGFANRTAEPMSIRVKFHLPGGVYTGEQLAFTARPSGEEHAAPPRLTRLESNDIVGHEHFAKTLSVPPGSLIIVREIDRAYEARSSWAACFQRLHEVSSSQAGRIRTMLDEGSQYLMGISARSTRHGKALRLSSVHQLLLHTSQAQAVNRNCIARGTMHGPSAAALMTALDALSYALAETSAAMLGLVPSVTVQEPTSPTADEHKIIVSLENDGDHSVRLVKLSLSDGALPKGAHAQPSDPALFDSVAPGQSVRATYRAHYPVDSAPRRARCFGEISYFVAKAPAHVQACAWQPAK